MEMIYNSSQYCVVEFSDVGPEGGADIAAHGGYEIMDKTLRREIFLRGSDAEAFRSSVQSLIESEPTVDEFEEFLASYSDRMHTPLTLH